MKAETSNPKPQIKLASAPPHNITSISLNMTCATVGLVIIFIPKLFLETGLILGSLMLVISGILSFITCLMLTQAAMIFRAGSFPELCRKIMGKYSLIVEFFFSLNLLGNIIGNHTFISKSVSGMLLHLLFPSISVDTQQEVNFDLLLMFVLTLCIIPFITSRDTSSLKKISAYSALGYVVAMFAVCTVFFFPWAYHIDRPPLSLEKMELLNWEGLTTATGMFFLAMAVHVVVIDIHSQLKPLDEIHTFKLFTKAHINSFLIFYLIGVLGFLCVYQDPQASSLNNFFLFFLAHKKVPSVVLRLAQMGLTFCIGIGNIFAYLPLIKIIENVIIMIHKEDRQEATQAPIELGDIEKNTLNSKSGMISKSNINISQAETQDETQEIGDEDKEIKDEKNIKLTEKNEGEIIDQSRKQISGYELRTQNSVQSNSREDVNVSQVQIQDIMLNIELTQGELLYKKIAIYLQVSIITMLFLIIKNRVSLYVVFNVVSAICYPTICLIFPSLFFMAAVKKTRKLTPEEKGISIGIILIGIGVLFFMVVNLFD